LRHEDVELIKHTTDALSVVTVIGALVNILPSIAALFTIIWSAIRIYESKTVQNWLHRTKSVDNESPSEE
jgi:hypothetical protein